MTQGRRDSECPFSLLSGQEDDVLVLDPYSGFCICIWLGTWPAAPRTSRLSGLIYGILYKRQFDAAVTAAEVQSAS